MIFSRGPIRTPWTPPKHFWDPGAPTPMGPGTPHMPHLGALGLIGGGTLWGLQTPNFFWEVQEVLIGAQEKIKWLVQLFHEFF